ncbi:MAG: tetratricopeptide repeat protein [Planctomyces sp.]|nr:tetratricopeptide repeat protein [Planctomyces sp.]
METVVADVAKIRDRFAESLRQGGSTDISPWLEPLHGHQRAALFRLLLSVVVRNSDTADATIVRESLLERFADYRPIIDEVFEKGTDPEESRSYILDCSSTDAERGNTDHEELEVGALWTESGGRYYILEEVARGGMGAVLRAYDRELDRPVALKVILPTARRNPNSVRRFHQEARITGQLQHPGIPPVHDVGYLSNECPFFAMKLIEGESLSSQLKRRTSPTEELPRFVAIFENICQAVAYAHTQGVVHRDLKPANVMVGEFGEVQVMDWGLARRLNSVRRPSEIQDAAVADSEEMTREGAAMGTPAYMPPEQACGLSEAINERSDVFGLAGILCVILTGRPPYTGESPADILEKSCRADLKEACKALESCEAPRPLIEIALQGLRADQNNRPDSAAIMARAILDYRESAERQLQAARIREAAEEARTAERRKRRFAWSLVAVSTLLILSMAIGGSWWVYRDAQLFEAGVIQKLNLTEQQLDAARVSSTDPARMKILLDAGSAYLTEVQSQRTATGRKLNTTSQEKLEGLTAEMSQLQSDQAVLAAFRKSRQQATQVDAGSGVYLDRESVSTLVAELRRLGISPEGSSPQEFAQSLRSRHPDVVRQLTSVLQFTTTQTDDERLTNWLMEALALLDVQGEQHVLLEAVRRGDTAELIALTEKILPEEYSPELLFSVAQRMTSSSEKLRFLRRAKFAWPDNFWLNHLLGNECEGATYLRENKDNAELISSLHVEAISCLNAAAAIEPENTGNLVNLGIALLNWGDSQAALKMFTRAIELNADYGAPHVMKGGILMQMEKFDEGVAEFETAVRVAPNFAPGYTNLARWHGQNGRFEKAAELLRKAVTLSPQADSYLQLGRAYGALNDYDRAIVEWEKAAELDPNLFEAHFILGLSALQRMQTKRAIQSLENAHRCRPQDVETLQYLGNAYVEDGQPQSAVKIWRDALAIDPNHGPSHAELGKLLYQTGAKDEAMEHMLKMHELGHGTPGTRVHLAIELAALGRIEEAKKACRDAIEKDQNFSNAWFTLSELQAHDGELEDAIASVRRSMEIEDPRKPPKAQFEAKLADYERQRALESEQAALTIEDVPLVDADKIIELAKISQDWMKQYHLSARLFQRRFSREISEQYPVQPTERFFGACAAAMAAAERHYDHRVAASDSGKAECRQLAFDWMSSELAEWKRLYPDVPPQGRESMQLGLQNWLTDPRLITIRDPTELQRLSPDEREQWQAFWIEVEAWRNKISSPN